MSEKEQPSKCFISISHNIRKKRKLNPTTKNLSLKTKFVRRNETWEVCKVIHGASDNKKEPVIKGMLDTLSAKVPVSVLSRTILGGKSSLVNSLNTSVVKEWCTNFESSHENELRSLNVYYSHNVMGKLKYLSIRKANKASTKENKVPNYISYEKLSKVINAIDIGELRNIKPTLTEGLDEEEVVDGCYRVCASYILRLAQFYLTVNKHRHDKLRQFDNFDKQNPESFKFLLAIGCDGAPLYGTSFLVSFLNVGNRIASSSENFTVFGGNVDESCCTPVYFKLTY